MRSSRSVPVERSRGRLLDNAPGEVLFLKQGNDGGLIPTESADSSASGSKVLLPSVRISLRSYDGPEARSIARG